MSEAYDPNKPNPFSETKPYQPTAIPDFGARRPGGLTAIAIVAVVIGVLGLLSGLMKAVNLAFGAQMQAAFAGFGAPNEEARIAQEEFQSAIMDETARFFIPSTILAVAQLALSVALIYAGIKALQLDPLGRKVLVIAFSLLVVYEVAHLVTFVLLQMGMMPIMQLYMTRIMRASAGPNGGNAEQFGTVFAKFSIIAGIAMQCGWTLVKLLFYSFSIRYLRKSQIVQLFPKPDNDAQPSQAL
jgi:hypothetical protein